jgi:hypothetical protein
MRWGAVPQLSSMVRFNCRSTAVLHRNGLVVPGAPQRPHTMSTTARRYVQWSRSSCSHHKGGASSPEEGFSIVFILKLALPSVQGWSGCPCTQDSVDIPRIVCPEWLRSAPSSAPSPRCIEGSAGRWPPRPPLKWRPLREAPPNCHQSAPESAARTEDLAPDQEPRAAGPGPWRPRHHSRLGKFRTRLPKMHQNPVHTVRLGTIKAANLVRPGRGIHPLQCDLQPLMQEVQEKWSRTASPGTTCQNSP